MKRTVLTTGANSGLGLATALELARQGFRSVAGVRSAAKAEIVREAAAASGVAVETVLLDVTDAERSARVIDELRPFGLVNNAGYGTMGAIEDVGDEEARLAIETMVVAPIRLARLSVPHMRAAGEGRIVNVSSLAGRMSMPLLGWYHAAKHALEALSDALRIEVAADGIHVVVLEPGGFKTAIWEDTERVAEERRGSRYEAAYLRSQGGVRKAQAIMGDPAEVAKVVASALTVPAPRARYMVGLDAHLLYFADQWMPTPLKDYLSRAALGL